MDVAAAGVNYIDTYQRQGIYPIDLPFVLGLEGAGTVAEVGEGVTDFAPGDRVAWQGSLGSYAARKRVPADGAVKVPEGVSDEVAAAAMLQGMTAHYLVRSTYEVKEGDDVLVHAAAGGVGLLLVQLAKARGARVIGTVSTEEKAQLARGAGADHVIRYDREDFAAVTRELTGGEGVAVVYDGVGKDTVDGSLASLKIRGLLALFGAASGPVPRSTRNASTRAAPLPDPPVVGALPAHARGTGLARGRTVPGRARRLTRHPHRRPVPAGRGAPGPRGPAGTEDDRETDSGPVTWAGPSRTPCLP